MRVAPGRRPRPPLPRCAAARPRRRARRVRAPRSGRSGTRRSARRSRRRRPRAGHARRTRRHSYERTLERGATIVQHGLTVRDEHHLDRQVEQTAAGRHAGRPVCSRRGAEATTRGTGAVPADGRRGCGRRERARACSGIQKIVSPAPAISIAVDAFGHGGRRVVAPLHLVAAALVKLDRDEDCYVLLVLRERRRARRSRRRPPADRSARACSCESYATQPTSAASRQGCPPASGASHSGCAAVQRHKPGATCCSPRQRSVDDAPMEPVRWGILSTARINHAVLVPARETDKAEVIAVASRDLARAQTYAREQGIERAYGSYEELLADDDVEAVYNSLPNSTPRRLVDQRARGRQARARRETVQQTSRGGRARLRRRREGRAVFVMEAFMYRHHPQTRKLEELVSSGAIGELRQLRSTFSFTLDNPDDIRWRPELEGGALWISAATASASSACSPASRKDLAGFQQLSSTGSIRGSPAPARSRTESRPSSTAHTTYRKSVGVEAIGSDGKALRHRVLPVQGSARRPERRADRRRGRRPLPAAAREFQRGGPGRGRAAARTGGRTRPGEDDRCALPAADGGAVDDASARRQSSPRKVSCSRRPPALERTIASPISDAR